MSLACIAIGSNAIRMLEADQRNGKFEVLKRERIGTRLFAGLVDNYLQAESMKRSLDAVSDLTAIARADHVDGLFVFATSAVRDAKNGDLFVKSCEQITGTEMSILTGQEEAVFSYYGANRGGLSGVMDIGGGSTEFTLGTDDEITHAISLQMGAVRMFRQIPIESVEGYAKTVELCVSIIRDNAKTLLSCPGPYDWTGVGGTMTTLGAMIQQIPEFDPVRSEGMIVGMKDVNFWGEYLAARSIEERRTIVGIMPHRADIMPSGLAILEAGMRAFGISTIRLSAYGNMDGDLKKKFSKKA